MNQNIQMSKSSRHIVDRELLNILDLVPTRSITAENLTEARTAPNFPYPEPVAAGAADVRVSIQRAKGMDGAPDVEFRIYQPASIKDVVGCAFHIHGGGFIKGDSITHEAQHRNLVANLGCVVVSVDYRLAPETHFPGNIEDCYAALAWIFEHADELSIDRENIGVIGESAGGGLAACLCLLTRDRGEFSLAFQHMMYPMLDDRTCTDSTPNDFVGEFIWTKESNLFGWASLLGRSPGARDVSPYAAAARASVLTRLPPTFICVGALDLFVDENIEYARRLTRAGVPTEIHVYPGSVHGFDYHPTAQIAATARETSLRALTQFLSR